MVIQAQVAPCFPCHEPGYILHVFVLFSAIQLHSVACLYQRELIEALYRECSQNRVHYNNWASCVFHPQKRCEWGLWAVLHCGFLLLEPYPGNLDRTLSLINSDVRHGILPFWAFGSLTFLREEALSFPSPYIHIILLELVESVVLFVLRCSKYVWIY